MNSACTFQDMKFIQWGRSSKHSAHLLLFLRLCQILEPNLAPKFQSLNTVLQIKSWKTTISLPILSCSSLGLCPRLPGVWGRGLCVWLPSGDAQPITGPAESSQHPVWRPLLAGPPALPQAAGPQHNAEPLQRQRHTTAVPLLWPPVQPGSPGEQRHCAACLRPVGALRTLQAYWWVL